MESTRSITCWPSPLTQMRSDSFRRVGYLGITPSPPPPTAVEQLNVETHPGPDVSRGALAESDSPSGSHSNPAQFLSAGANLALRTLTEATRRTQARQHRSRQVSRRVELCHSPE